MQGKSTIILILLAAINFTHILDFMIMMPLGNYLMPFFKIHPAQFTYLVAAYTISAGISGFLAAFFVDNYDRKKVLLFGYIGFLLGTLACGLAPTYHFLLGARLLAGTFGGLIGAQVLSIISDMFTYEHRGKAMGSVMSAFAIASTLGVPFSLYLANLFSWHAPFLMVVLIGAVTVPFIFRYIPTLNKHIIPGTEQPSLKQRWTIMQNVLTSPTQRLALVFSGMIMLGHFLVIPFINPFLEFNKGFSKAQTPMVYLAGGIASFFAANVLGKLADKRGKLKVFTICVLLSLPLVVLLTNLPDMHFALVLVIFAFWFVLSTGRGVAAQALVSNVIPPATRGSFMSFNSSIQQLGTSLASLLAGVIVVERGNGQIANYPWIGAVSVVVLVGCVIIGNRIFRSVDVKASSQVASAVS
ncbi:Predicted arabinose efflux permease, MFS family [Cnuella takakiae]|uniref:Predicted arabinose efflux permease, MFS family n=1 Tax=Cnuella takakiae TaxID=1302690 RepID=A0A1M5I8P8_9BACT|nr:MFS transporter [Cnuella takakiae]OLY94889.1 MFS transporter [Cnuella takakiae]SHG24587.1 Predicted arabinose efflux permease, MFS family [Cnuella takakiae]